MKRKQVIIFLCLMVFSMMGFKNANAIELKSNVRLGDYETTSIYIQLEKSQMIRNTTTNCIIANMVEINSVGQYVIIYPRDTKSFGNLLVIPLSNIQSISKVDKGYER